ncbi:hypothetical protein CMV_007354 [Castanea mollissima]|uniref:Uncharacterized protein n=1 Tax=Castanea mollissima TaxID=60419 RepID=A0A8J4RKI7_9ROSI|nr:hypothetical protein CMV_007354 [Castanea mollissima]
MNCWQPNLNKENFGLDLHLHQLKPKSSCAYDGCVAEEDKVTTYEDDDDDDDDDDMIIQQKKKKKQQQQK